jgi:O-antigen/teichoic acid export membrane protein
LPGTYLGNILDKVMFPSMARFNDSDTKLYAYYKKGLTFVNAIMFPATLLLILFSREIIYIILGKTWLSTVPSLRILFLCLLFRVAIRMCDSVIRAKGLVYKSAKNKFINALILTVLVYIGHFWDVNGICIAMAVFSLISYISMSVLVQKSFNKTLGEVVTSFFVPIKYTLFIGIIAIPGYYLAMSVSSIFMLPMIASVLALMIVLILLFTKFPNVVGEDIIWFLQRFKNIVKSSE